MTLDHLRPKAFGVYKNLKNDPRNLVWSCHTCNNKKENHWPALGTSYTHVGGMGFLDPFIDNRREYFKVRESGEIEALKDPAQYMIQVLLLNRTMAQKLREKRIRNYQICEEFENLYHSKMEKLNKKLASDKLSDEERSTILEAKDDLDKMLEIIKELEFDTRLY